MSWPAPTVDGPIDPARRADPYAIWAAATQGAYLASHTGDRCRLALQVREDQTLAKLREVPGLVIPAVYPDARFVSGEMTAGQPEDWQILHDRAVVLLAEPGMAGAEDPVRRLDRVIPTNDKPTAKVNSGVVIGVIDGACGFAHRHFRRKSDQHKWQSRLIAFWDQQGNADENASSGAWRRPQALGYGRELVMDKFNALLEYHLGDEADNHESQAFGERALYRALGVDLPAVSDWTHGTHVLDSAAGLRLAELPLPPANAARAAAAEAESVGVKKRLPVPVGEVDAADLVFVQLPEVALRDTSGRWIAALVLDGLRYILSQVEPGVQVVINLSLAAFAGPHDGSSMIEKAVDQLVEDNDNLTVVVAAGNAAMPRNDGDGGLRPCHAEARLEAAGHAHDEALLEVDIDRTDSTETFVELWLPDTAGDTDAARGVTVELVPPGASRTIRAGPGEQAAWRATADDRALAMVVNLSDRSDDGPRGAPPMVLIAIGSTSDAQGPRAPTGIWQIVVRHLGKLPVAMHAWIERRDVPGELAGERPQYGFGQTPRVLLSPANTLGSLANGSKSIVVGAAEYFDDDSRMISDVSSTGPVMRHDDAAVRPEPPGAAVFAPGEFGAAGFLCGSRKTLKGTSMAAASVTRLIAARLLEAGPPEAGIRAWLQNLAAQRTPSPPAGGAGPTPAAAAAMGSGSRPIFILPPEPDGVAAAESVQNRDVSQRV